MNWINFFGTDHLGRDVFSRVVHGSYMVISLSIFGTMIGLVIGSFTGLLSAYIGGWLDEFVQRFNEALISIPFLVLGLLAILVAGPKLSGEPILMALAVALSLCTKNF